MILHVLGGLTILYSRIFSQQILLQSCLKLESFECLRLIFQLSLFGKRDYSNFKHSNRTLQKTLNTKINEKVVKTQ